MTVLMRLTESITNNMKQQSRPLECICGSSDIALVEGDNCTTCLRCEGCGHSGPGSHEADYVSCVLDWNVQISHFEDLLETL